MHIRSPRAASCTTKNHHTDSNDHTPLQRGVSKCRRVKANPFKGFSPSSLCSTRPPEATAAPVLAKRMECVQLAPLFRIFVIRASFVIRNSSFTYPLLQIQSRLRVSLRPLFPLPRSRPRPRFPSPSINSPFLVIVILPFVSFVPFCKPISTPIAAFSRSSTPRKSRTSFTPVLPPFTWMTICSGLAARGSSRKRIIPSIPWSAPFFCSSGRAHQSLFLRFTSNSSCANAPANEQGKTQCDGQAG